MSLEVGHSCPLGHSCESCGTLLYKTLVPQECPTRVSHKSVTLESDPLVGHEWDPTSSVTRVSYKSVPQECPLTRGSHKSVSQECPTRGSLLSVTQEGHYKSVPQEGHTRVSHKRVTQECPTRVSLQKGPT